jgi:hypothetical protein
LAAAVLLLAETGEPRPQRSRLRADLDFLTSDVLAGRLSLTPQADIAARYIAAEFQKAGLQPANGDSYLQEFPLVAYRPGARQLILTRGGQSKTFRTGPGFSGGFYREVDIKGAVVFAGYGITAPEYGYDDYAKVDAKGKIVLIFDHEPQENNPQSIFNGTGHTLHALRWLKLRNARQHGAVAALIANEPVRSHGSGGGRAVERQGVRAAPQIARASAPPQSLDDPEAIPGFSIGDDLLAELLAPLHRTPADIQASIDGDLQPRSEALPDTVVELSNENAEQRRGVSLNAVGLLEGSDPMLKSETVLMTAHYDHLGVQNGMLYPGANSAERRRGGHTGGHLEPHRSGRHVLQPRATQRYTASERRRRPAARYEVRSRSHVEHIIPMRSFAVSHRPYSGGVVLWRVPSRISRTSGHGGKAEFPEDRKGGDARVPYGVVDSERAGVAAVRRGGPLTITSSSSPAPARFVRSLR